MKLYIWVLTVIFIVSSLFACFFRRFSPNMFIVDRIEEDLVVVEWEGGHFHLPKELIKEHFAEGDLLNITITVDQEGTDKRIKRIQELMQFDE